VQTCLNRAQETYIIPVEPGVADLWRVLEAYRLSLAAKVDRGEISDIDANLMNAQKTSEVTGARQARIDSHNAVRAAPSTAPIPTAPKTPSTSNRTACERYPNLCD
jgi:hypothetical protein